MNMFFLALSMFVLGRATPVLFMRVLRNVLSFPQSWSFSHIATAASFFDVRAGALFSWRTPGAAPLSFTTWNLPALLLAHPWIFFPFLSRSGATASSEREGGNLFSPLDPIPPSRLSNGPLSRRGTSRLGLQARAFSFSFSGSEHRPRLFPFFFSYPTERLLLRVLPLSWSPPRSRAGSSFEYGSPQD